MLRPLPGKDLCRFHIRASQFIGGLCVPLIIVAFGAAAHAQQPVEIRAYVDNTTVGENEAVNFTLEIQGAGPGEITQPEAPPSENLVLLSPVPGARRSFRYSNGQMQRSVAFEWRYRPAAEGAARIGSASVQIAGETYRTEAIYLQIAAQSQRAGEPDRSEPLDDGAVFIGVEVSDRDVYLKEPVQLIYRLYFLPGVDIRQSRMSGPWEAEGFWREEMEVDRHPFPQTVVHNGRQYQTIVIKRSVVFPTRTGRLEIDPLPIESEVYDGTGSQGPFSRFFSFGRSYEAIEIASPSVNIDVRPLPEGEPASFSGAVGYFDMQTRISRRALAAGEASEVRVEVTGRGNVSTLEAPAIEAPDSFEIYDPDVNVSFNRDATVLRGETTFTYVVVPRAEGNYALPPVTFSYFNPASEQYETLRSDSLLMRVAPAPMASNEAASFSADELAGPMTDPGNWVYPDPVPLHRNPWAYAALSAPWLALIGLLVYTRRRRRLEENPELSRRSRARSRALEKLTRAERLAHVGRAYAAMEEALLGYLEDALEERIHGLTRSERDARLADRGVTEACRRSLDELLVAADRAQFAPIAAAEPAGDLERARDLVESIENARHTRQ